MFLPGPRIRSEPGQLLQDPPIIQLSSRRKAQHVATDADGPLDVLRTCGISLLIGSNSQ